MPWNVRNAMSLKEFVSPARQPDANIRELCRRILVRDLWLRFLYPVFQLGQHRLTTRLAGQLAIFITAVLKLALDTVELVDQIQCDVCPLAIRHGKLKSVALPLLYQWIR